MSENYPDVLGFLTRGKRHTINVIQAALTTKPHVVRAGHHLEAILLLQNMSNVKVDVTVALQLPNKDADGKRDRILSDQERLVAGLQPAEVGYIMLPVATLPDTSISNDYSIEMDITVKPLGKPEQVRSEDGGTEFDPYSVPKARQKELALLRKLKFSTGTRGFLRGNGLQVRFGVRGGTTASPLKREPGWISLWTLADQDDVEVLLDKYRDVLRTKLAPNLDRKTLYGPLLTRTSDQFERAGYPLKPVEAKFVTKLMTLVLEYGNPRHNHQSRFASPYELTPHIKEQTEASKTLDLQLDRKPPPMPHWVEDLLRGMARDERVTKVPAKAIPFFAYEGLLKDAILYGFREVEYATGEELGTDEEMRHYAATFMEKFKQQGEIDFSFAYMPLVMGGVLMFDQLMLKDEHIDDILDELKDLMALRGGERDDISEVVFALAQRVIEQTLKKYGSIGRQM